MSYLTCVRQHCASSLQLATATHKREAPTTQSLLASTGSRDSACGRSLCPGVGVVTNGHVTGGWAWSCGGVGVVTKSHVTGGWAWSGGRVGVVIESHVTGGWAWSCGGVGVVTGGQQFADSASGVSSSPPAGPAVAYHLATAQPSHPCSAGFLRNSRQLKQHVTFD